MASTWLCVWDQKLHLHPPPAYGFFFQVTSEANHKNLNGELKKLLLDRVTEPDYSEVSYQSGPESMNENTEVQQVHV